MAAGKKKDVGPLGLGRETMCELDALMGELDLDTVMDGLDGPQELEPIGEDAGTVELTGEDVSAMRRDAEAAGVVEPMEPVESVESVEPVEPMESVEYGTSTLVLNEDGTSTLGREERFVGERRRYKT